MAKVAPSFSGDLPVTLRIAGRNYIPAISRLLAVDAVVFELPFHAAALEREKHHDPQHDFERREAASICPKTRRSLAAEACRSSSLWGVLLPLIGVADAAHIAAAGCLRLAGCPEWHGPLVESR